MINKIISIVDKIGKDKILHFLVCYIVLDFCLAIGEVLNFNITLNYVASIAIVVFLMFLKEAIDEKRYNGWDWYDILAGCIGAILKTIAFFVPIT